MTMLAPSSPDAPLLAVEALSIAFPGQSGRRAVESVSFSMGAERVGIVGESGSGKSLTARAIMGLLPASARLEAETLAVAGRSLLAFSPRDWTRFRGREVGLVLQDPRVALDPVMAVGAQIEESLRLHTKLGRAERRDKVLAALESVGLPDPARIARAYPHELSGGMGQRAMIASVLVTEPRLLIADEPTSALDHHLRDQVLDLLIGLTEARGMGLVLISHDLEQVSRVCDRALVMFRGRIVDRGRAADLPLSTHPYTSTLWRCRPSAATRGTRLPTLDRASLEAASLEADSPAVDRLENDP